MAQILIIDDMEGVRKALATVLRRAKHTVTEADDGSTGLDIIKKNTRPFDLIITDILMPKVDGLEVVMAVEKMAKRPPILAISGGGNQLPADAALLLAKVKADAILTKPFDNADFLATVDKLLAGATPQ